MASLVDKISSLERSIAWYEAKLDAATTEALQARYVNLITEKERRLNMYLEQQQQAQAGGGQGHQQDLLSGLIRTLNEMVVGQNRMIHMMSQKEESASSPADRASQFLSIIHNSERDIVLGEGLEGESVLNDEESRTADSCKSEQELVAFLTPFLSKIFNKDGMVVVNSEKYPWLKNKFVGAEDLKPDLFVVPSWAYETRFPKEGVDSENRFGVVADPRLYDCVYLLEANLSLSPTGTKELGQLLMYLQHLCRSSHAIVRGMLFDKEKFWLITCQGVELVTRTVGKWNLPGTVKCIRDYFPPPCWDISVICEELNVQVDDPHLYKTNRRTAFLGAGLCGRVCKVKHIENIDSSVLALKVMKDCNQLALLSERSRLYEHSDNCSCAILARPVSDVAFGNGLCGYLLRPVGETRVTTDLILKRKVSLETIFHSLRRLHLHDPIIIHGDARIANLIVLKISEEILQCFWVDLTVPMNSPRNDLKQLIKTDAVTLFNSISCTTVTDSEENSEYMSNLERAFQIYIDDLNYDGLVTILQQQYF